MPFQVGSTISLVDITFPRQTSSDCLHPARAMSVAIVSLRILGFRSEQVVVATFSVVLGFEVVVEVVSGDSVFGFGFFL